MKVLIIDDERTTREGLRRFIRWETLGFTEVCLCESASEALRRSLELKPELIVSDIRMPDMDGLTLCRELRKILPRCQIILISAYADKEYFKEAIRLQAVSYVEKPIDREEFEAAVSQAAERITAQQAAEAENRATRREKQELFLRSLFSGHSSDDPEGEGTALDLLNGKLDTVAVCLVQFAPITKSEHLKRQLEAAVTAAFPTAESMVLDRQERQFIILIGFSNAPEEGQLRAAFLRIPELQSADSRLPDAAENTFIAVGSTESGINGILRSYQNAAVLYQELFFTGYGKVLFAEDQQSRSYSAEETMEYGELENTFRKAAAERDRYTAGLLLKNLYASAQTASITHITYIRNYYVLLLHTLLQETDAALQTSDSAQWEQIHQLDTLREIHAAMQKLVDTYLVPQEGSAAVRSVKKLIAERCSEESLSVKELAAAVYVTDSYLSRLFKQEVGMTVGQYITKVRMDKAKELLLDPQLKLYHVAMLCGYSNPSYFAKQFKKGIGMMPSEYRERMIR